MTTLCDRDSAIRGTRPRRANWTRCYRYGAAGSSSSPPPVNAEPAGPDRAPASRIRRNGLHLSRGICSRIRSTGTRPRLPLPQCMVERLQQDALKPSSVSQAHRRTRRSPGHTDGSPRAKVGDRDWLHERHRDRADYRDGRLAGACIAGIARPSGHGRSPGRGPLVARPAGSPSPPITVSVDRLHGVALPHGSCAVWHVTLVAPSCLVPGVRPIEGCARKFEQNLAERRPFRATADISKRGILPRCGGRIRSPRAGSEPASAGVGGMRARPRVPVSRRRRRFRQEPDRRSRERAGCDARGARAAVTRRAA